MGFSSSRRESVTRSPTSLASRPDCVWILRTHSLPPSSMASTSALVDIAVRGVLSSCPALVMNCFCISRLRIYGATARRAKSRTSMKTAAKAIAATSSVEAIRLLTVPSSRSALRKMTLFAPAFSLTR